MSEDVDIVLDRLKRYIETVREKELPIESSELNSKHLINHLAFDSLDLISLLFQIKKHEGLEVTEADMEAHGLYRVGRLAEHILKEKSA